VGTLFGWQLEETTLSRKPMRSERSTISVEYQYINKQTIRKIKNYLLDDYYILVSMILWISENDYELPQTQENYLEFIFWEQN